MFLDFSNFQNVDRPYALVEENQNMKKASPLERVDEMFERLQEKLPGEPEFILCVLPERKCSDLYGMIFVHGYLWFCCVPLAFASLYAWPTSPFS